MSEISVEISLQNASFRGRNCDFAKLITQRFSIPSNIVYYMAQNPISPISYQKLIKCCKYFYPKNPILVVDEIRLGDKVMIYISDDDDDPDDEVIPYFISKPHQILCKLWVTLRAEVNSLTDLVTETLLNKIFRINAFWFYSTRGKSITVELDSILRPEIIKSVKKINLYNTYPKFADGTRMPVENVFEFFPNLEDFNM